jgi:hypothetical protein
MSATQLEVWRFVQELRVQSEHIPPTDEEFKAAQDGTGPAISIHAGGGEPDRYIREPQ